MRGQARSNLLLLMTAIIWGSAFIAQSKGADVIGPFTFNTVRYALAVVALLPVIYIFSRKRNSENTVDQDIPKANGTKTLIIGGIARASPCLPHPAFSSMPWHLQQLQRQASLRLCM